MCAFRTIDSVRLRNNNWILGVFVRAFPGKTYSEKLIAIKAISFIKVNRTVTLPNITVAEQNNKYSIYDLNENFSDRSNAIYEN